MAIKKRVPHEVPTAAGDDYERRVEEFGQGADNAAPAVTPPADKSPADTEAPESYDPEAKLNQGTMFRFNDYQKKLLAWAAGQDRRSNQKELEALVWPVLEQRRAEYLASNKTVSE